MITPEVFTERLEAGRYDSPVNASRALGQMKFTKQQKTAAKAQISSYFTEAETSKEAPATRTTRKKATRKRRTDGKVLNGAGDSRTVTLFKLSQHPDAFELMAHLIAKAVDEGATLPELHEDVQSIARLLQS